MQAVPTGSATLDESLGGGLPSGCVVIVAGEPGAGAAEFAWATLRAAAQAREGRRAILASAVRTRASLERDLAAVLGEEARAVEVVATRPRSAKDVVQLAGGLGAGDVLAIESLSALERACGASELPVLLSEVQDACAASGATVLVLHADGSVPAHVERAAQETAEGLLSFAWRSGGSTNRRVLVVRKLPGLPPLLDAEEIPVFEVAVRRSRGFEVSRVRNVV